ncbi:cyclin-dependent kinase 2-interacting protein [Erythrolamprus reginae]|uniref:cyclin-dependent kinase 2-interacting protein n=1 Tax=Erythrolamprus reginae TaxID=121349 RepID=UPI00396C6654
MAASGSSPRTPVLSISARKIKDNAADWHNLIMKWETLNDNGFSIATKIANIKNATQFKDSNLEIDHEDPSDSERLPLNSNMELEQFCTELLETFKKLAKIHEKMEKLCSTTKGVCDLEAYHHTAEPKAPLFHTWPVSHFYDVSLKLLDMYSQELKLKHTIVEEIAHTTDQDLLMVYLSSWLYQPYIDNNNIILLESMLLETGHRQL